MVRRRNSSEWAGDEEEESESESVIVHVRALYKALASKDADTVHRLLAPDLEWWFHGPPSHQYLMRLLTGASSSFVFSPISVVAFGATVLAEGYDPKRAVSWVHAWTFSTDPRGLVITHLKEYLNTSLTVINRFPNSQCLWHSKVCAHPDSLPALLLPL